MEAGSCFHQFYFWGLAPTLILNIEDIWSSAQESERYPIKAQPVVASTSQKLVSVIVTHTGNVVHATRIQTHTALDNRRWPPPLIHRARSKILGEIAIATQKMHGTATTPGHATNPHLYTPGHNATRQPDSTACRSKHRRGQNSHADRQWGSASSIRGCCYLSSMIAAFRRVLTDPRDDAPSADVACTDEVMSWRQRVSVYVAWHE